MARKKPKSSPLKLSALSTLPRSRSTKKKAQAKKPRPPYRMLVLSLDLMINEFITQQQKNIHGTETEKTSRLIPPGYREAKDLHIVDTILLQNLRNWQDARGKYELYEQKRRDGPLYDYGTPAQIEAQKNTKALRGVGRIEMESVSA